VTRPVFLGVVGDSAAGKTTLTRGIVRILGSHGVSHISGDDYHRYGRQQRAELEITPLDPAASHLDIMRQHLEHLRRREPILKPVYDHRSGTLGAPEYVRPHPYVVVEGLLGYHSEPLRDAHDIRVFLAPPEELRRTWKVTRDCTRRGYTTHEVLAELDRRERDVEAYINPQRAHADIVVSFVPAGDGDPAGQHFERLDAHMILRDTLRHPDLSPFLGPDGEGPALIRRDHESLLRIPGDIDPGLAAELEEAVWQRMQYASHLRAQRLGEFTVGTGLHRSESLALAQTLLLYHLVSTRAEVGAGIDPHDRHLPGVTGADSALHT
jgi:phosphoribulokinase